jgi:chromosome transmission fidelity protein 1
VLLHPAACFTPLLREAHAVALVGGTLRPFVHVAAELLSTTALSSTGMDDDKNHNDTILREAAQADAAMTNLQSDPNKISHLYMTPSLTAFTCDHVVSSSNVLLQCLARGPTGQVLDLRFQSRNNPAVMDELGLTMVQICATAPSGVVVFVPSYSYEAQLVSRWKRTSTWDRLRSLKKVHREPKSSQHVEAALQAYTRDATREGGGALLFSVVGGKMSEGINFSDDMARCVVLVGLPYPDITDPELLEKMAALDRQSSSDDNTSTGISGQAYYQNLCMRAVNQSVGRAIRHANDYAAVVLLDQRFTTDPRIWTGLPTWLKRGGAPCRQDFPMEQRVDEMKRFFTLKQGV